MTEEQRRTREAAERMRADIIRAIESGAEKDSASLLGNEIFFDKGADGGFTISAAGQAVGVRVVPADDDRPADYPDVPFVPGEAVTISQLDENTITLTWWAPREPSALLAVLRQICVADGWRLAKDTTATDTLAVQESYERDGVTRDILRAGGMVTLIQTPQA